MDNSRVIWHIGMAHTLSGARDTTSKPLVTTCGHIAFALGAMNGGNCVLIASGYRRNGLFGRINGRGSERQLRKSIDHVASRAAARRAALRRGTRRDRHVPSVCINRSVRHGLQGPTGQVLWPVALERCQAGVLLPDRGSLRDPATSQRVSLQSASAGAGLVVRCHTDVRLGARRARCSWPRLLLLLPKYPICQ